jgi:hypothetical protein
LRKNKKDAGNYYFIFQNRADDIDLHLKEVIIFKSNIRLDANPFPKRLSSEKLFIFST